MKIGVLTLPFNNNYGGLLQAYALQSYLKQRGHEVYSIQQPLFNIKILSKAKVKQILKIGTYTNASNMQIFQHQQMQETIPIRNEKDLKKLKKYKFDTLIVGSDQVWRYEYIKENYSMYFLDFFNSKKISYAASFGKDSWDATKEVTQKIKELIKLFDAVSVREKSGQKICENNLNRNDTINLLDPTLLMEDDFYRKLYTGKETKKKGGIGFYFLDPCEEKIKFVNRFEKALNLSSFSIGKQINFKPFGVEHKYPSVAQWLCDFDCADFIITDSFHGMIFATIFKKEFFIVGNNERGLSRFDSFLSRIKIDNRLSEQNKLMNVYIGDILNKIDYTYINGIFEYNKIQSDIFLKKQLI